jgi:hypothetical protein
MKRFYVLFLLNACAACIIAQTPISLNNSHMPGNGDTLRYTNFQASGAGNYTMTGAGIHWDFSQVVSTTEGLRSFVSALQTPYALFFLNANEYGEKISDALGIGPLTLNNVYSFYRKQSSPVNAFVADGIGVTYSSVPIPNYYSDRDELYHFPMSYPKYDSSTFKFSVNVPLLLPASYFKTGYRVTVVDGWGTVTTPYGTEDCLRLVTTQYAQDSVKSSLLPTAIGFQNFQRSYQWLTLDSKIPYLEITGTLTGNNFTPVLTRYRGYDKDGLITGLAESSAVSGFSVGPNPAGSELHVYGAGDREAVYEVYSTDGRLLRQIVPQPAPGSSRLDVSGLPAGMYLLRAAGEQKGAYVRFMKD